MTGHVPAEAPDLPQSASEVSWHRLHPLSPFVRAGRQMMSLIVVLAGIAVLNQHQAGSDLTTDLVIVGIALVGGFVSWLVTRWQLTDDVLRVESGLIRRSSQRLPLAQIQAVDIVQSGLARALGLAELQLRMAGGGAAGGRLACLRLADAEELRHRSCWRWPRRRAPLPGVRRRGIRSRRRPCRLPAGRSGSCSGSAHPGCPSRSCSAGQVSSCWSRRPLPG